MNIFDRLAQGPDNDRAPSYSDWDQMVGAAPPGRFGHEVTETMRQIPSQEYYRHSQPGIDGTDPFGSLGGDQRQGIAQTLLGALFGRGIGQREIMQRSNIGTLDPRQMSPDQLASLAQYIQREHPEVMGQVAEQYRDQPDLLSRLFGNKALMMLVAAMGAKFLADRNRH